jgi:hypothetical protein
MNCPRLFSSSKSNFLLGNSCHFLCLSLSISQSADFLLGREMRKPAPSLLIKLLSENTRPCLWETTSQKITLGQYPPVYLSITIGSGYLARLLAMMRSCRRACIGRYRISSELGYRVQGRARSWWVSNHENRWSNSESSEKKPNRRQDVTFGDWKASLQFKMCEISFKRRR